MSERIIHVTSDRQWQAIVRALRLGLVRLPGRQAADVRRFLDQHHDATEDDL